MLHVAPSLPAGPVNVIVAVAVAVAGLLCLYLPALTSHQPPPILFFSISFFAAITAASGSFPYWD